MAKKKKKQRKKQTPAKKKRKILYGRIFLALVILFVIIYMFIMLIPQKIQTIHISGNEFLTDQEVLELAELEDYPSTFAHYSYKIEKDLESSNLITKATVKKKWLYEVSIHIEENRPLFYDSTKKKTVLESGETTNRSFDVPVLINYTPDKIYKKLITKMHDLDTDIIRRISEMQYDPNDVDPNRFLFTMNDGNYVYLTANQLNNLNSYVTIISKFEGKKGILYLDSGEYFQVMEG